MSEERQDLYKSETYQYPLPEDRIARFPLPARDQSKLLIYKDGMIQQDIFVRLSDYLPKGSLLVFNDTKVIPARLLFRKKTGAVIEIFCLDPYDPSEYSIAFGQHRECRWKCLIGNRKRWKDGPMEDVRESGHGKVHLTATLEDTERESIVRFTWDNPHYSFAEVLTLFGIVPLPPYLKREAEELDRERYQTIYARNNGSVAAPTAGLHFTQRVFSSLNEKGILSAHLTLHVAAGTFQPVKHKDIREHDMHTEHFSVTRDLITQLANHDGPVIPVGTTSVRTLESLYILGTNVLAGKLAEDHLLTEQWEWENIRKEVPRKEALEALANWMQEKGKERLFASTRLMIIPGYRFSLADAMITNFHQPGSTLLMLVAAYTGKDWKKIYSYALENGFRFLSYGDACLLFR